MIKFDEFDWSKYDGDYKGGNKLVANQKIKGQSNKVKCFSHEPYAQKLFDTLTSGNSKVVKKDLVKGDCVPIVSVYNIRDGKMIVELLGGLAVDVDLGREKRFIQLFGFNTVNEFCDAFKNETTISKFIDQGLYAFIIEASPSIKISLWQGHIKKSKDEFMEEIKTPSKAYVAKVYEANKGGFFVEVHGVEAFMPGSLAAPNKINNFQSYVGKEVIVMIEDYLKDMNSFIVSHKKYIEHVLPKKINELDLNEEYSGTVTGTSKYGIFIEFNELFTGLLHHSKMKEDTLSKFRGRKYKPGDEIKFYINEISKDNRIILTEESKEEKRQKIAKFIDENGDNIILGNVAAIMNFGIIVNAGELSGLVPSKDLKRAKISIKNYVNGDDIEVQFKELNDDKIVFKIPTVDKI